MLAFDGAESADARRDEDADFIGVLRRHRQLRIVHRELAGRDRIEDEGVDLLHLFLLDEIQRVEAFDFTRNLHRKAFSVEVCDPRDSTLSRADGIPRWFGPDADR